LPRTGPARARRGQRRCVQLAYSSL
jgi:hypothetical protein